MSALRTPQHDGHRPTPGHGSDSTMCYLVHRAAMRTYIEAIWGWDEQTQQPFHPRSFKPARTQIVIVDGHDPGVLIID